MSLELTLLVTKEVGRGFCAQTLIQMEGMPLGLTVAISQMAGSKLPAKKSLHSYFHKTSGGEFVYGETEHTAYGERLKLVRAGDLANTIAAFPFYGGKMGGVLPAYNFVKSLDQDRLIGLYWH